MRILALSSLVMLMSSVAVAQVGPQKPIVFRGVRLFDGEKVTENASITVANGKILAVNDNSTVPKEAQVIEGQGKTLLPGLIDAHTHVVEKGQLAQTLVFGVTTELDMFMSHELAQEIRREQAAGKLFNLADFRSAGTLATRPKGHGTEYGLNIPTISKPEEAQLFVEARIAEGSDYIKVVYGGDGGHGASKPVLQALVDAAHKRKKLVIVCAWQTAAAQEAVLAGADGLAHLPVDREFDQDFTRLLSDRKPFVVATLTVFETTKVAATRVRLWDARLFGPYLSSKDVSHLKQTFLGDIKLPDWASSFRKMKGAGVTVLAGTDAPNPGVVHGASLHRELELLVAAGLKPTEALSAATSAPAKVFGLTDRGRIAPGLRADLLLVEGDPTTNIIATRRIVGVWQQGRPVDRVAYREKIEHENKELLKRRQSPAPKGSESGWISDFEQGEAKSKFGFGWAVSTDSITGGESVSTMKVVEEGAQGSKRSLEISGELVNRGPASWAGAMFFPGTAPMTSANLSGFKSIAFWAKGDGQTYSILVYTQSRGFIPVVKSFVASPEWKEHTVAFEDADIDGTDITGFLFGQCRGEGKFKFRIDGIMLTKDVRGEGARSASRPASKPTTPGRS